MLRLSIVVAALCFSQAGARAEDKMVVDMSKLTCSELTKLGFQDFAGITMWLSGYYNASVRSTVIDLDQFAQAAKTVKDTCAATPRATVMSAAERRSASKCHGRAERRRIARSGVSCCTLRQLQQRVTTCP